MDAVDAMSLHQLVRGQVRPQVVGGLHLCVLQCTGSHWPNERQQLYKGPPPPLPQDAPLGMPECIFVKVQYFSKLLTEAEKNPRFADLLLDLSGEAAFMLLSTASLVK